MKKVTKPARLGAGHKLVACLVAWGVICVAGALTATAAVTLTQSTTVTELDPQGYTSDTDVTLTVNLANDVTYSGVVAGRVAVVKKGAGRLTLTEQWT